MALSLLITFGLMDTEKVKALANEVREIVLRNPGGRAEPSTLASLDAILFRMKSVVEYPAYGELAILESSLRECYSARKHKRVPGGLPQVRSNIEISLRKIEGIAGWPAPSAD